MMVWLTKSLYAFNLTWSGALWGLGLYLVTFIGSTVLGAWLLIKLPATYFCDASPRSFWSERPPVTALDRPAPQEPLGGPTGRPRRHHGVSGIPGPGILMLVLGIMLLDFPGKRRLEQWLIRRPTVLSAMNRLRQRYGKPPLVVECSRTSMRPHPSPCAMQRP